MVCEAQDSFRCSVPLDDPAGFSMRVSLSVSGSVAPTVLLEVPARPGEWQHLLEMLNFSVNIKTKKIGKFD